MVCSSPEGQTFRSKASLLAYLLQNKEGVLDISVFDFSAPKDKCVTPSVTPALQVKQRRRKKEPADGREGATQSLEPPPNRAERVPSSHRRTNKEKTAKDVEPVNTDVGPEEVTRVSQVCRDNSQATPLASPGDVRPQSSLQRVGLLREKLFRRAPSISHNTLAVHQDEQSASKRLLPSLTVEPATESEVDDKLGSEPEADADSRQHVGGEVLPDNTGRSCAPGRLAQNSKTYVV